jgi:1-acyl-sn-glycerol-3-phosphate acyltransferase
MRTRLFLAKVVNFLFGWKAVGPFPQHRKYVMIAAPHTTNWDLLFLLSCAWASGVPVSWMGKHQIFRWPVAGLFKALGGVPVRRDRRNDLVAQMAAIFAERDEFVLVIPPEATRSRVDFWKSGFYRIAIAADVPIHFGYLDYPTKTGGFGAFLKPTGDIKADMDVLRAFYADKVGKNPEWFGPVRLKEEIPDGE